MKKVVIAMGILVVLSTLLGCSMKKEDAYLEGIEGEDFSKDGPGEYKKIQSFDYGENGYAICVCYNIEQDENNPEKTILTFTDRDNGYDEVQYEISDDDVEKLSRLCEKYNILSWDKYSRVDTGCLDGSGFHVRITYEDGTSIYGQGDNCFPKNYYDFVNELRDLFNPYTKVND